MERNERKVREGIVVSDKMDKTVVVLEETMRLHKIYKKRVKTSKKYKAHDENNECGIGDRVQIMETRPLSKDKRWRVVTILENLRGGNFKWFNNKRYLMLLITQELKKSW